MPKTVLCIDDDREIFDDLDTHLRRGEVLIHTADLEEAFSIVVDEQPDLVLLEIELRGGDGLDFAERVRAEGGPASGVPIVVVTRAGRTPVLYGRAVQLGVADYLTKPVVASQLVTCVEECLDRKGYATASGAPVAKAGLQSGRLRDLPLPELLDRVYRWGESGVLIVGDSRSRTGIQIRNGSPAAVTLGRSESLDGFLVRTGRITEKHQHRAVNEIALGSSSIEEILLGMGVIDEPGLEDALQERAEEEIFRLFELPEGRFRFEPGRRLKGATSLDITRSAQSLIVRGVLAWFPFDSVRTALARYGDLHVVAGARPEPGFDDVPFSDAQRDFTAELSGDRTVNDFLGGSEFEQRTLYAYAIVGAIDLCPDPMLVLEDVLEEAPREELPAQETPAQSSAVDEPVFDFEDGLFDAELAGPAFSDDPALDRSYESDLFEKHVFDEDSFEREMVEVEGAPPLPFESERSDEAVAEIGEALPEVSEPAPAPEGEPERVEKAKADRKPRSDEKRKTRKRRKAKRRKKGAEKKDAALAEPEPEPAEPVRASISQDVPEPTSPVAEPAPEAPTLPAEPTPEPERRYEITPLSIQTDGRFTEPTSSSDQTPGAARHYEIAPLGSLQMDADERTEVARRVQKQLHRRYGHLVDRHAEAPTASAGSDGSAERALEAESWFRKGRDLLKSKKYEKAVEAFGMSAHLEPGEGEYVAHLGYALYLSQPDDEMVRKEALEDIARGIKLSPHREISYVYLGRIFKVTGDVDVAKKMFTRALRIRPHCREAALELRLMETREQKKGGFLGRFRK